MQLSCNHPRVIYHPHSRMLLTKYRHYTDGTHIYHSSIAHYKPYEIPYETIDNYKIFNPANGETFPLFLQVRCNHCILCRKRRTSQWAYRCVCEQRTSQGLDYFLTLTYNNKHYPTFGLYKRDIQLFIKRLRRNIERKLGKTVHLRYICCGEYGKNTKRGHYHLNLFNVPKEIANNTYSMLKFIERNWSIPTGKYNSDGSPLVEPLGFAYCLPLTKGGIEYILKYMLKSHPNIPENMNPPFFTYSQGIGRDYIKQTNPLYKQKDYDYHDLNFIPIEETCFDILRGKSVTRFHTDYTKNYHYPSESQLLTPFFRKYFKLTLSAFNYARDMFNNLPAQDFIIPFKLPAEFLQVIKQLKSFHLYDSNYYHPEHQKNERFFRFNPYLTPDAARSRYDDIYNVALTYMRNMLLEYDQSVNALNSRLLNIKSVRQVVLNARLKDIQQLNLQALSDKQYKIIRNYENKDKF